jgi:hypothetical protein
MYQWLDRAPRGRNETGAWFRRHDEYDKGWAKSSWLPSELSRHVYDVHPRKDKRGVNLISDVLPYSPLWYAGPNAISNAISFAKFFSRSHNAVVRIYDQAGNVIETHEHAGDFKEWWNFFFIAPGVCSLVTFRRGWNGYGNHSR